MDVRVRLFAVLRERAGREVLELTGLDDGLDVAGLKAVLAERHPELGDLACVRGVVGTTYVDDAAACGPEVALLPPVSGGDPGAADVVAGVFELSGEPLDPAALAARVAHDSCGAVVTFTGVTRDRNRGEDVVRLDYEAFAEMAGPEMARIFARCREAFGPGSADGPPDPELELRMACAHRTGVVPVGEPSVVIAVASPHRDAAFAAARFLIDALKDSLPVWKREHYEGGHHWLGQGS